MPPHIGAKEAVGFSLYSLKAVVSGRGTELLDIARTNLVR